MPQTTHVKNKQIKKQTPKNKDGLTIVSLCVSLAFV